VRKKYAKFEGSLRGVDARILTAQVPGGMLTNMENQLRDQGASDKFDEVLAEIPRVREDLGFIPLVTPTSQIVGTQAVLNVLTGERYKSISKETQGVLKGEYGATPAAVNAELQARVLQGAEPITCRPADLLEPELDKLVAELNELATQQGISLAENAIDDVLTYALFPQVGLKFLANRGNPAAFEPVPGQAPVASEAGVYTVSVNGTSYTVEVSAGGDVTALAPVSGGQSTSAASAAPKQGGEELPSPLAGNIFRVDVAVGAQVAEGDIIVILEAMKMETEIRAPKSGQVTAVHVAVGDSVVTGDAIVSIA
jgi:oxaloacetate decarboxylase alpha subunit